MLCSIEKSWSRELGFDTPNCDKVLRPGVHAQGTIPVTIPQVLEEAARLQRL